MKPIFRGSILGKIFAVYALTVCIVAAGYGAARFYGGISASLDVSPRDAERYLRYLAGEIGSPPDVGKARDIADKTGLGIVISGSGGESLSIVPEGAGTRNADGDYEITVGNGAWNYEFTVYEDDKPVALIVLSILLGTALLGIAANYAFVRTLLAPLGRINRVAREFGEENWKARVNPRGTDELADLGRTLDAMADRIETSIRSAHDLLRAVSHEIRSPLTRMRVALELVDDPRIAPSLEEEIVLLDRLTGTLLERESLAEGTKSLSLVPTDLREWLSAACAPFAASGFPVVMAFEGPDASARIDRARADMALRNLIENSNRHAPGSPIRVTLRSAPDDDTAFSVEVLDEGPGIAEADIERIGEPFLVLDPSRSGPRAGGGFGLGLSIVRAVVAAHGGSCVIRNAPSGGLSVTLTFPNDGPTRPLAPEPRAR